MEEQTNQKSTKSNYTKYLFTCLFMIVLMIGIINDSNPVETTIKVVCGLIVGYTIGVDYGK